jgi:hypothetical protein
MTRVELQALMQTPADTMVPWGPGGKLIPVGDAIHAALRGDGQGVEITPAQPALGQPGNQAGPGGIRISQAAVNNLTQAQYDELSRTGHLQGVTNSENGRALVHVTQGGSYSTGFSLDETGQVGPARPIDLRDFHNPDAPASSK